MTETVTDSQRRLSGSHTDLFFPGKTLEAFFLLLFVIYFFSVHLENSVDIERSRVAPWRWEREGSNKWN